MASQSIYSPDLDKLLKDLKKLDPQLRSTLNKSLTKAVQPVRDQARRFVPNENPVRNWRPVQPTYQSNSWINDFEHRGRDAGMRWNWRPIDVRRGIKTSRVKKRTGRSSGGREEVSALSVINTDVAGIIYELTGAGTNASRRRTKRVSRNPNAGNDFELAMNRRGKPKRLVLRAAELHGKGVQEEIQRILETQLFKFVRG